jgi:hypothetical protein
MPLGPPINQGMQKTPRSLFRNLRDPGIFRDERKPYPLSSLAGEGGNAGAVLRDQTFSVQQFHPCAIRCLLGRWPS